MLALQLFVDGLAIGALYGLLGVGFTLIMSVSGRFHMAYATTYAFAGYVVSTTTTSWGIPFIPSLLIGVVAAALLAMAIEKFVYQPLGPRTGAFALLAIFVASLGLLEAGTGAISLIWIHDAAGTLTGLNIFTWNIHGLEVTNLQVIDVVVCLVLVAVTGWVLRHTLLGRMIRAVRSNPTLSVAIGISTETIFLVVFAIGSALGAAGAILNTAGTAVQPTSGLFYILYALTIMFLAGPNATPLRVALVGFVIALVQTMSDLWLSPVWNSVIVFGILFVYAALRPFGVSQAVARLVRSIRGGGAMDGPLSPAGDAPVLLEADP